MPNMSSYTYMHNHKVLNDKPNETGINNCNCRDNDTCPLPNSCQTKCIIYQANSDCNIAGYKQKCYFGSGETACKDLFGNHKKSFNHAKYKNYTKLSKNFGKSKSAIAHQNLHVELSEYVVLTTQTVSAAFLCLNEKYEIATYKGDNLLNKRTEIIKTCRHRSMYKLANWETTD